MCVPILLHIYLFLWMMLTLRIPTITLLPWKPEKWLYAFKFASCRVLTVVSSESRDGHRGAWCEPNRHCWQNEADAWIITTTKLNQVTVLHMLWWLSYTKFWPDQNIIFEVTVTIIFPRFQLWTHKAMTTRWRPLATEVAPSNEIRFPWRIRWPRRPPREHLSQGVLSRMESH